jgi:hypothetical protein
MNSSLALNGRQVVLDCAGVTLTTNSLAITDEDSFHRAGRALLSFDSYSQFWWGDYLLYAERHGLSTVLESASADLHRSTIYGYIEVSRLFRPEDRHPDLPFTHHAAIRYILGEDADIDEAKKWLALAAEKKFTAGDLREAMRTARREDGHDPGPMRGVIRMTDFQKISRWTETVSVRELPEEKAEEIRKCAEPLFNFLCELYRRPFVPI